MNTNTLEKFRKLKFHGVYHAFKNCLESWRYDQYTAEELLAQLVDAVWDDRHNKRIARQIFYAKFRSTKQLWKMSIMKLRAILTEI